MSKKYLSRAQVQNQAAAELEMKLEEGTNAQLQGRVADAERVYSDIVKRQPNHFDALQRLGIIAAQKGQTEQAVQYFRKIVKLNSGVASAHRNLGLALKELKRTKDALESFDKAIALKPDYAECHNSRGLALQELNRCADALMAYDRAIEFKTYFPEAHYNRGLALRDLNRLPEALAAYDRAIDLKPFFPEAYFNRGVDLEQLKRPTEALASYDRAIALKPTFAEAHSSRGNVLLELRRLEEALASQAKAIAIKPDFPEAYINRGNALMYLMRPVEALESCDTAIALKPDSAEAYNNRGNILQDLRRFEEALVAFDKAIALKPDYIDAYNNKSFVLLRLGRFEEGWRLHEWRKMREDSIAARAYPEYPQPLWLGEEDISGKTLFIWWEQGFGDTIQFCRYAKLVEALGARVILSVQDRLQGLLQHQLSPTIVIVDPLKDPPDFDYHCPLMSLPLALGTMLDTIPAEPRYIKADEELRSAWTARLPQGTNPKIGIVWSGSQSHRIFNRSIPLKTFLSLMGADVNWICLQKEMDQNDAVILQQDGRIVFYGDEQRDFSDAAALIDLMDLVITIDTSVAHLAGAMGKPVWILLPYNAEWRWLVDRNDSPWYPNVRLFRQREIGNWQGLIEEVKGELASVFLG